MQTGHFFKVHDSGTWLKMCKLGCAEEIRGSCEECVACQIVNTISILGLKCEDRNTKA